MKKIKNIVLMLLLLIGVSACETYGDYEVGYTAIHPLGGNYQVSIHRNGELVTDAIDFIIANTTANEVDKCWVRIGGYNSTATYAINGKLSCDLNALTFSGSAIENLAGNVTSSTETFTITDGKVVLNGETTPSGAKGDKVNFTYTTTKDPGATYTVSGYRRTGWPED